MSRVKLGSSIIEALSRRGRRVLGMRSKGCGLELIYSKTSTQTEAASRGGDEQQQPQHRPHEASRRSYGYMAKGRRAVYARPLISFSSSSVCIHLAFGDLGEKLVSRTFLIEGRLED